ncbi:unnamed protein product [Calicophoron daubneyi]|uniref:GPI-anchor transamidase n=1 Tax=Calicophoron daubneyi TaxID=300641 RepID=A0AAV2TS97_CALDB
MFADDTDRFRCAFENKNFCTYEEFLKCKKGFEKRVAHNLNMQPSWSLFGLSVLVAVLFALSSASTRHTSNWAVLVDTSLFWFNYRHLSNTLAIYRHIKRLGIPDSRIILMVADDASCNARNPRPANIYNSPYDRVNLYGESIEIDYRGNEATVENFVRLLTGRLPPSTPSSKRLNTDENSNILIFMTGHGGEGFLKFRDENELSSSELADAIEQMWQKRRYHEILFIVDTCQAESMGKAVYSPNVVTVGSSSIGEESLSLHVDRDIGVFTSDRYSYYAAEFLKSVEPNSKITMDKFLAVCPYSRCHSTVVTRTDLLRRPIETVPVTDFFGSVRYIATYEFNLNVNDTQPAGTDRAPVNHLPKRNTQGLHYVEPLCI